MMRYGRCINSTTVELTLGAGNSPHLPTGDQARADKLPASISWGDNAFYPPFRPEAGPPAVAEATMIGSRDESIGGWDKRIPNRPSASLSAAIRKFIGDNPVIYRSGHDKVIFLRAEDNLQVVYDRFDNYFRIEAARPWKNNKPEPSDYFDLMGNVSTDNGKTHFNNTDFSGQQSLDSFLGQFGVKEKELLTRGGTGSKYYNTQQILGPIPSNTP
jgi:hypothetical protein